MSDTINKKEGMELLRKILASKDERFALLDDSFAPKEFFSISKIRDCGGVSEWKGEAENGNCLLMQVRDTYLFFGEGETEFEALKNFKRVFYFNFDNPTIEDIVKYTGIKVPEQYSE